MNENEELIENLAIQFKLGDEIGKDGFNSEVFEAYEINLKRTIAIKKILRKDLKVNYYEEAILLNESNHPNVVDIHYAGEGKSLNKDGIECEYVYLAMPLYKNGSLQKHLSKDKKLLELFKYVFGILNGMLHIHTKGILHSDMKPDNILISDKDDALITDFGVATKFDIETSFTKNKKNLLIFVTAPETIAKNEVAIQSDIYQIGLLLYLLFNKIDLKEIQKKYDFTRPKLKETLEKIKTLITNDELYPKTFAEHIPEKAINIILKCMKTDPNERYKSVEEIINEFADIKEDSKRLLWIYQLNDTKKIWTRTIDSITERCILESSGEISYSIYENEKIVSEKNINEDLRKFFNNI